MLHQDNWTQEVTHSLKKFEKQLIIALKEKGWDGKEDEATVTWTFAGALFYCITVITTIGKNRYFITLLTNDILLVLFPIISILLIINQDNKIRDWYLA